MNLCSIFFVWVLGSQFSRNCLWIDYRKKKTTLPRGENRADNNCLHLLFVRVDADSKTIVHICGRG